jgi:hypothetical protein
MVIGELAQNHIAVPQDDREQVIEIVSNTSGEASHGFHLLRLLQLLFEALLFGDIRKERQLSPPLAEINRTYPPFNRQQLSVFALARECRSVSLRGPDCVEDLHEQGTFPNRLNLPEGHC